MSPLRLAFLLTVLVMASGYKFRCWWMCQDQTAIQNDYVEQRDVCREYAQLKLDMAMRNSSLDNNDQNRKAMLISLFSHCMAYNGWNTTDITAAPLAGAAGAGGAAAAAQAAQAPKGAPAGAAAGAAGSAGAAQAARTQAAQEAAQQRSSISRTAECAFARQSASVSSIAAARAKACDLECAQRLKLAPEAPRPAACPGGETPTLTTPFERTY